MNQPALRIVPSVETAPRPVLFNRIAAEGLVRALHIYSQIDFHHGAACAEQARRYESRDELFPTYSDSNLVDLGAEFTKEQIQAALNKKTQNEDPAITALRVHIVETVEAKKMFWSAPRTTEEAEKHGFRIGECKPGILAYEM